MKGRGSPGGTAAPRRRLLSVVVLAAAAAMSLLVLHTGQVPEISIEAALPGIGPSTQITVEAVTRGRGLGSIRIELEQGELRELLAERQHRPRPFWAFWGARVSRDSFVLSVGHQELPELEEGQATIRVVAERAGTWLRRPAPAVAEKVLPVQLRPPSLAVTSTLHYAQSGGSELVVYQVGPTAETDGVRAGASWFPGFALPDGNRFCLFGLPHDLGDAGEVRLVARDAVGNEITVAFLDRFTRRAVRRGRIRLTEEFMARVVPPIVANSRIEERGELLQTYLAINGELRRQNAQALRRLAEKSRSAFLWQRPFLQLPNSQVMSSFAVDRTYVFEGTEVDRQTHLGFDLASSQRAPVPAANAGVVVLAEYFGIYGNTVVVDHGYGLMSLYAHLSRLSVQPGQEVERGEELGLTGVTGLAGGDHLHFSMLLQGVPVDPLEWWDGGWIRDRIARKLPHSFGDLGR